MFFNFTLDNILSNDYGFPNRYIELIFDGLTIDNVYASNKKVSSGS